MKTKEILIESDLVNIKKKDINDLNEIADQIRQFLIQTVSQTGGHIGTNLGVVELTLALHYVFDINNDKLIFDTGHQGYTHKLLTGRLNDFSTLNQENGMSRFLSTKENENDLIEASHAGTAISIASGYAYDFFLNKKKNTQAVAIVGDGALVEGMSFEGLNFGTSENLPLVIIINDNGMAIPENIGGIKYLGSGENWKEKSEGFFRGLGYQWASVADGHNISELVNVLSNVKSTNQPIVCHVKTTKGKGLEISKKHPYKLHFSMPFDPESGEGTSAIPAGVSYTIKAGEAIQKSMKENEDLLVLTPSTPYASALDDVLRTYPDRCVDVGMAEQHLLGMAVGLSKQGRDVFACYQSTFLQRAFDQILHDIAYMDVPITILSVRSGFSGLDSPTHHGIYDIAYLRSIPQVKLYYPGSSQDLQDTILHRKSNNSEPMIIFYPYENIPVLEEKYNDKIESLAPLSVVKEGVDGYIFVFGNQVHTAWEVSESLAEKNIQIGIINIKQIKPFPETEILKIIERNMMLISIEEASIINGLGTCISEIVTDNNLKNNLLRIGINDGFVKSGSKENLEKEYEIDKDSVIDQILANLEIN